MMKKEKIYKYTAILLFVVYIIIIFLYFMSHNRIIINGLSLEFLFSEEQKNLRQQFIQQYLQIFIEYITPWFFLLSCVCFAICKKWGYWLFGIGTVTSAICISIWRKAFVGQCMMHLYGNSGELSSQKFTVMYIIMAVFMVVFPILFCVIGENTVGRITLLLCMGFISILPSMQILLPYYKYSGKMYVLLRLGMIFLFLVLTLIYKYEDIRKSHMCLYQKIIVKMKKRSNLFVCTLTMLSICILFMLFLLFIRILPGGIVIKNVDLRGYYYLGSVEQFIKYYKNPYQSDRVYLNFEYLGERESKREQDFIWEIIEKPEEFQIDTEKYWVFCTYERELEKVCYLQVISEDEVKRTAHRKELQFLQRGMIECNERSGRVVLGMQESSGKVYYYAVEKPEVICHFAQNIEGCDISVQGKEIPAYYWKALESTGGIIVNSYSHFWGELDYNKKVDSYALMLQHYYHIEEVRKRFPERVRQY